MSVKVTTKQWMATSTHLEETDQQTQHLERSPELLRKEYTLGVGTHSFITNVVLV